MSLLGEISKTTEALRYHSKTAEIAGQNLAHVNDESYARQRVLSREGVMYGSHGGLQTSGLESAGLEHVRNLFLDRRVVDEVGQTAAIKAEKEVFDLIQSALGETLTSPQINAGLDDTHDSILAPGSLSRAINDFFNAFQELSASPDEPTIRQELFNKIVTLGKRFNDAGQSLEEIEHDLTQIMKREVSDINRILDQLHEVNKQVRRFELQDKGLAVTYRDRRQALVEDLSKLMEVSVEEGFDEVSGESTGFLNVFATSKDGQEIRLLDSTGAQTITNNWGYEFSVPSNGVNGSEAKVQAKIDSQGQLGFLEVMQSGTFFDDTKGPFLVSLPPPKPLIEGISVKSEASDFVGVNEDQEPSLPANQPVDDGTGLSETLDEANNLVPAFLDNPKRSKGEVFYSPNETGEMVLWQALEDTIAGENPISNQSFMEINALPNGLYAETKKSYSDLETFEVGDQIYYEGKFYQVNANISPVTNETENEQLSKNYLENEVFKHGDNFYQATSNLTKGISLEFPEENPAGSSNQLFKDGEFAGSVVNLGKEVPSDNNPLVKDLLTENQFLVGDYVRVQSNVVNNEPQYNYYITTADVENDGNINPASSDKFLRVSVTTEVALTVEDFKETQESTELDFKILPNSEGKVFAHNGNHYVIQSAPEEAVDLIDFDPTSDKWSAYFKPIKVQINTNNPDEVFRRSSPTGYNLETGALVEVNVGIAEAVISGGEISGFKILNNGNGYPSEDALLISGDNGDEILELVIDSGSIAGYQNARENGIQFFRTELNEIVSSFVEKVNSIHNPTDEPGGYLFEFDAFLSRPVMGNNRIMEENYQVFGAEGNGTLKVFDKEVSMSLPYAESDTFEIVNSTPLFPSELSDEGYYIRGNGGEDLITEDDYEFFGSARRMQHITFEYDDEFVGEDGLLNTGDEGRSIMHAYENIPFKIEQGTKPFIIGDNFHFDAVLANPWNLAASLKIDKNLSPELLKSSELNPEGANDIAYKIGNLADGEFNTKIASLNADIGNKMSNLSDNYDHQKSLENLLLDQRRAVSSVSVDEEVADLMQFQRSFQASSRVLNTLDKMLELVVMGLLK